MSFFLAYSIYKSKVKPFRPQIPWKSRQHPRSQPSVLNKHRVNERLIGCCKHGYIDSIFPPGMKFWHHLSRKSDHKGPKSPKLFQLLPTQHCLSTSTGNWQWARCGWVGSCNCPRARRCSFAGAVKSCRNYLGREREIKDKGPVEVTNHSLGAASQRL